MDRDAIRRAEGVKMLGRLSRQRFVVMLQVGEGTGDRRVAQTKIEMRSVGHCVNS